MNLLSRLVHLVSCKEATRLLSQNQDRRLGAGEALRLRLHLAACTACSRFARQLRVIRRAMRGYHLR